MDTLTEFLAHAVALEQEAVERYEELAGAMRTHNNLAAAELFDRLAQASSLHAGEVARRARELGGEVVPLKPWQYTWPERDSPEAADLDQSHYLMTPHHVLRMALAAEQGARQFYAGIARDSADPQVRELAKTFAAEEAGHAGEIERWLERYPDPDAHWQEDLDSPREPS